MALRKAVQDDSSFHDDLDAAGRDWAPRLKPCGACHRLRATREPRRAVLQRGVPAIIRAFRNAFYCASDKPPRPAPTIPSPPRVNPSHSLIVLCQPMRWRARFLLHWARIRAGIDAAVRQVCRAETFENKG